MQEDDKLVAQDEKVIKSFVKLGKSVSNHREYSQYVKVQDNTITYTNGFGLIKYKAGTKFNPYYYVRLDNQVVSDTHYPNISHFDDVIKKSETYHVNNKGILDLCFPAKAISGVVMHRIKLSIDKELNLSEINPEVQLVLSNVHSITESDNNIIYLQTRFLHYFMLAIPQKTRADFKLSFNRKSNMCVFTWPNHTFLLPVMKKK